MPITSLQRNGSRPAQPAALQLELQCDFAAVREGAAQLRTFLKARGLTESDIWACELAFVEACNNAVQHAPVAKYARSLEVQASCENEEVELQIRDANPGFHLPERSELPCAESENGRGLFLIRSLMDQVDYVRDPCGNRLVLKKNLSGI